MPLPAAISSKFVGHWDLSNPANLTVVSDEITVADDLIGSNDLIPQSSQPGPDYLTTMGPNGLKCGSFVSANNNLLETVEGVYNIQHPFELWMVLAIDSNIDINSQWLFDAKLPHHYLVLTKTASGLLQLLSGGTGKNGNAFTASQHGVTQVCRILFKDNGGAFNSEVYLNEVAWGFDGQDVGSSNIEELAFGGQFNATFGIDGRMGEYALADDELSATEVAKMWTYLSRWTTQFGEGVTFDTARGTAFDTARETTMRLS